MDQVVPSWTLGEEGAGGAPEDLVAALVATRNGHRMGTGAKGTVAKRECGPNQHR